MKKILNFVSVIALFFLVSCQEDIYTFGDIDTPSNFVVTAQVLGQNATTAPNGDGSGKVLFTAKADNAISYRYIFGDGTTTNAPSGIFEKRYNQTGVELAWLTDRISCFESHLLACNLCG